jgi:hypothetical protein
LGAISQGRRWAIAKGEIGFIEKNVAINSNANEANLKIVNMKNTKDLDRNRSLIF